MKKILLLFLYLCFFSVKILANRPTYYVEVSHNDEFFIINGSQYSAQTYCLDIEEDDPVIFLEGNADGLCTSAEIINLRTKQTCELWCE